MNYIAATGLFDVDESTLDGAKLVTAVTTTRDKELEKCVSLCER